MDLCIGGAGILSLVSMTTPKRSYRRETRYGRQLRVTSTGTSAPAARRRVFVDQYDLGIEEPLHLVAEPGVLIAAGAVDTEPPHELRLAAAEATDAFT